MSDLGAGIAKQIILVQELAWGNRDKKQRCQGAGGLGLGGQGGDEKELSRRQLRGEMRIVAAGRVPGWESRNTSSRAVKGSWLAG